MAPKHGTRSGRSSKRNESPEAKRQRLNRCIATLRRRSLHSSGNSALSPSGHSSTSPESLSLDLGRLSLERPVSDDVAVPSALDDSHDQSYDFGRYLEGPTYHVAVPSDGANQLQWYEVSQLKLDSQDLLADLDFNLELLREFNSLEVDSSPDYIMGDIVNF